jgi:hypothetical protein
MLTTTVAYETFLPAEELPVSPVNAALITKLIPGNCGRRKAEVSTDFSPFNFLFFEPRLRPINENPYA